MANFYAVKELISRKYVEGTDEGGVRLSLAPVKYLKLPEAQRVSRELNELFDDNRVFRVAELVEKLVEDDND